MDISSLSGFSVSTWQKVEIGKSFSRFQNWCICQVPLPGSANSPSVCRRHASVILKQSKNRANGHHHPVIITSLASSLLPQLVIARVVAGTRINTTLLVRIHSNDYITTIFSIASVFRRRSVAPTVNSSLLNKFQRTLRGNPQRRRTEHYSYIATSTTSRFLGRMRSIRWWDRRTHLT